MTGPAPGRLTKNQRQHRIAKLLGFQRYHSFVGERNVSGRLRVTGLVRSSTISFAGKGGQLLLSKTPPPMNVINQGHLVVLSL